MCLSSLQQSVAERGHESVSSLQYCTAECNRRQQHGA